MRIRRLISAVAFLIAAQAGAQTLTQKIDVSVVNVDVVVTGADGKPVRGLTRDDFQIFEDGAPQPITNFYAVDGEAQTAAAALPAAATPPPDDPRFRRKVLVLIDNNHLTKHARDLALKNLEEFVNDRFRGGEYDWSIAAIGSHVNAVMPLTSNKATIHAALQAIRTGGPRSSRAEFADLAAVRNATPPTEINNTGWSVMDRNTIGRMSAGHDADDKERSFQAQFTTDAIIEAARAFAGASGKKIILFITDDPGLNDLETSYFTSGGIAQRKITPDLAAMAKGFTGLRDRIIHEANASNVSFYIINAEGLRAPDEHGQGATNNQAAYWLANETGGRLMPGNDGISALKQFDTASSNFYSLGFRPRYDDGKYHRLTVKVARPGDYNVQHRAGYSSMTSDAQLSRALQSSIATTVETWSTIPVTLATEAAQSQKKPRDAVLVPFSVSVPVSKLQFLPAGDAWSARLDIYVSVFDQTGRNVVLKRFVAGVTADSGTPDPTGNFVYKNALLLRKGQTHRIVVAVRDQATEAMGMADSRVRF